MSYSVVFASRAVKDLRSIPRKSQEQILEKAENLGENP